ncbi:glycosyltransferase family 2 protein [Marinilabilia salmonicolor]|uniref:glycosyltransferase family 2 protein n=1 Tax=Marinilabilia salmonicolor TaxID=989 RepID=UPI00068689BB|nr:glycosyltransferase family 2 protein [Marinilabilia salmonicolor]
MAENKDNIGHITIYAIVVTYNGVKWVEKCFSSLVKSTVPLKILAIDNASTDGTPGIIKEKFPQVEVIETGENLGFGKANNIGLKRVLGENANYAFLLNQDAWVEEDTIEKLVEVHQQHQGYGILSPVEFYRSGVLDIKFKKFYAPNCLLESIKYNKTTICQTDFINAAGWLLPNKTIKIVGGFDEIFIHYGEDVDFCKRTLSNNFKIGITSNTRYFHDRPQLLIKDSSPLKQIHHNHIKRILYLRWGDKHWIKKQHI